MFWSRGSREYLRASKFQIVLQGKNICLSMKMGRGNRPGTACGYTQCRVLRSLQHLHERLNVVGLTGVSTPIMLTAVVSFNIGNYYVTNFKFAIVPEYFLQHCFLLGLDFMIKHDITLDLCNCVCKTKEKFVCNLRVGEVSILRVAMLQVASTSHQLRIEEKNNDVCFALEGNSCTVTGLSLLCDEGVVKVVQERDRALKLVKKFLSTEPLTSKWPCCIKQFSCYKQNLSIVNGAVVYSNPEPILVISFLLPS